MTAIMAVYLVLFGWGILGIALGLIGLFLFVCKGEIRFEQSDKRSKDPNNYEQ